MRDIILGVNDGLVSMFVLIVGLSGGNLDNKSVLLAGITGAIAGSFSMALGEYMATKSQAEVVAGDLELEKEHFKYHREVELDEVEKVLEKLNFKGDELKQAVQTIGSTDEALLKFMQAFEFGFTEQDSRNPAVAMLMSGSLFLTGSLPSVVPFACTSDNTNALISAIVLCAVALFAVGSIKTISTKTSPFKSGTENLVFGGAAAAICYGIGALYSWGRG